MTEEWLKWGAAPELDMAQTAKGIFQLMNKSRLDRHGNRSYTFHIEDGTVDITVRKDVVITISCLHSSEDSDDDETHEEEVEGVRVPKPVDASNSFFLFANEAQGTHMDLDFVDELHTFADMERVARLHPWCHAYHPKTNTIFDFVYPEARGVYDKRPAKDSYLQKFYRWRQHPQVDERTFYVFADSAHWPTWRFLGKMTGLGPIRIMLKQRWEKWAHAYDPTSGTLIDFAIHNRFTQKRLPVTPEYTKRFQEWQNSTNMTNTKLSTKKELVVPLPEGESKRE